MLVQHSRQVRILVVVIVNDVNRCFRVGIVNYSGSAVLSVNILLLPSHFITRHKVRCFADFEDLTASAAPTRQSVRILFIDAH